ncbi:hypothetical protein LLG46_10550 [bacterium]|nr:hypothetical protein [bacterium]
MATIPIEFIDCSVIWNCRHIDLPFPIKDAFVVGKTIIVLFKQDAADLGKSFQNLIALDSNGSQLWIAALPEVQINGIADAYLQIVSREPLIVYTWSGYDCTIDIATGKILKQQFTK